MSASLIRIDSIAFFMARSIYTLELFVNSLRRLCIDILQKLLNFGHPTFVVRLKKSRLLLKLDLQFFNSRLQFLFHTLNFIPVRSTICA